MSAIRASSSTCGAISRAPSAQLIPTACGRACATAFQNASTVWPDSVRPDASVIVTEIHTGGRSSEGTPSRASSMATRHAFRFSVSKEVSGTITDLSGRTLSGQTVEAFFTSVRHAKPFAVGLNCALGAAEMRPFLLDLARVADTRVSVHPNAGLPNAFGGYDETPETTAHHLTEWAKAGLVNIVGGCCGTTPEHVATAAAYVRGLAPRALPEKPPRLRLSGLEAFELAR